MCWIRLGLWTQVYFLVENGIVYFMKCISLDCHFQMDRLRPKLMRFMQTDNDHACGCENQTTEEKKNEHAKVIWRCLWISHEVSGIISIPWI